MGTALCCSWVRGSYSSAGRNFLPIVVWANTQGCDQSSSSLRGGRGLLAAPPNTKRGGGGTKGYKQWEVAFHTIHGRHGDRMLWVLKFHTVQTNSGKKVPHNDPLVTHSFGW